MTATHLDVAAHLDLEEVGGHSSSGRPDWAAIRALAARDLLAVRRSKAVMLPMLLVPALLLIVLPIVLAIAAGRSDPGGIGRFVESLPQNLSAPIIGLPENERIIVLVHGHLLAPLFLIVPLMVSAVIAADAFAGEKERRSIESLLYLPVSDRDLFLAKIIASLVPAVAISWIGFALYALVSNVSAWPVMHRVFLPTALWMVVILWVAPAVALLGLGVMVRVSARATTTQEANQLGGAVILPLIFLALGQSTGLLLLDLPVAIAVGLAVWLVALLLTANGARRFARDRLAAQV
ncbi:MAG: ABC transporter permease subunit [Acidimicrobiales bacterium]|jgi:ABC-type Na+ efflux pump permease subunit|nr:ABC transporter permease subunit [Acidimicrobiales bacterium]